MRCPHNTYNDVIQNALICFNRRTYTSLLHANGEDVKVVQELLQHGSARIAMDYAQAMTPAKRRAQGKVVAMLRDTEKKSS